jgi:hypothetical protein
VYQDEFVNWVKTNFASREAQNKFVFYSLDNEPDLWSSTHPEAQGGGVRITWDNTSAAVVGARLQAPRSLWDPTYNETSWIQSSIGRPMQLIPMLKTKIAAHYPGTKLAFTEYNYGAGGDISGGIAQADVLGVFAQQGVFAANMWGLSSVTYINAAFQMYQDPAGNGTKVGDTSVSTTNSDIVDASAYGFANSANANEVDAVVLNKTASPITTTIQITNSDSMTSVKIYQLTSASAVPQPAGTFAVQNNQYQYTMPAYSVSTLVFAGGSNPTAATHDFDGDGKSDIAWRDTSGNTAIWEMNGTAVTNQNSSFVADVSGQWAIVGQRDFNGDGKADLLWRDTSGNVAIWEMNGTSVLNPNTSFVGNVPSPQWSIVGTGDFNADAKGDLLWQDTSGNVAIWEMNGTSVLNQNSSFVAKVPSQWSIKGTGDFNGDGKTDILWQDISGNVAIWEMNGTAILNQSTSFVGNVLAPWSIKGTGDFNGDGKADILWRDLSGNVAIWEMNGTTVLNQSTSFVSNVPGPWSIQLTGDYNGDGKADILWQDTSGNLAIWEMNGTAILNLSSSYVANVPGPWSVQILSAE